jgi:hypothetical protein
MTKGIPAHWAFTIRYFREPDTVDEGMATATLCAAVAVFVACCCCCYYWFGCGVTT